MNYKDERPMRYRIVGIIGKVLSTIGHFIFGLFWDSDTNAITGCFFAIIVIAVIVLLAFGLFLLVPSLFSAKDKSPCWSVDDTTYACRDYQVTQCIADDKYSKDQCIALLGGK